MTRSKTWERNYNNNNVFRVFLLWFLEQPIRQIFEVQKVQKQKRSTKTKQWQALQAYASIYTYMYVCVCYEAVSEAFRNYEKYWICCLYNICMYVYTYTWVVNISSKKKKYVLYLVPRFEIRLPSYCVCTNFSKQMCKVENSFGIVYNTHKHNS